MDEYTDLFPKFHADEHGNIVAYSNGRAVLITRAERKRDAYTAKHCNAQLGRECGCVDTDRRDSNPNGDGNGPTNGDAEFGD